MTADLAEPPPSSVAVIESPVPQPREQRGQQEQFEDIVEQAKEAIRAGEVFQVVAVPALRAGLPGRRPGRLPGAADRNPSPYMYLFRLPHPDGGAYDVVGSSPEALVKVNGRHVMMHPIAGSRPRGATPEEDTLYAEQLLADDKERAEHVMLVDLARNDVGRVCDAGHGRGARLHVGRALQPHHAHRLDRGRPAARRAARRTTPWSRPSRPGTLSGAPKVRAMELIEEFEEPARPLRRHGRLPGLRRRPGHGDRHPHRRHPGPGRLRAGRRRASSPTRCPTTEYEETQHKAAAVLRAVQAARGMRAPVLGVAEASAWV